MKLLRAILLTVAFAVPAVAFAQWQWVGKDGRKVFSDQPPPNDIPAKSILRQPGGKGPAAAPPEAAAAAASVPARPVANTPKLSGKDKELDEKRKQSAAAEAEKKQAQEEELAKARADNCARAKRAKASFDSGVRISRTNDKGEREIMDDATRSAESKRVEAVIASECKPAG